MMLEPSGSAWCSLVMDTGCLVMEGDFRNLFGGERLADSCGLFSESGNVDNTKLLIYLIKFEI